MTDQIEVSSAFNALAVRRREILLVSACIALAGCGAFANLTGSRSLRAGLIADATPLPNAPWPVRPIAAAHSHNDYVQPRPLQDALALGFQSVEADIWLRDGEILVSHIGLFFVGTLRELYLDPLQARVDRLGSVYGDGQPFLLWIELKSSDPELVRELQRVLARYPMLTRKDAGEEHSAVTVILTGDENGKRTYTSGRGARYACRDSEELSADEERDPLHLWYSLNWTDWFSWNGKGAHARRGAQPAAGAGRHGPPHGAQAAALLAS